MSRERLITYTQQKRAWCETHTSLINTIRKSAAILIIIIIIILLLLLLIISNKAVIKFD